MNFQSELIRWAEYDKKESMHVSDSYTQVDTGIYKMQISFRPKTDTIADEIITNTKDMEAAIKRMFQYGYKKISISI